MAKKTVKKKVEEVVSDDPVERLLQGIEKKYGEGILCSGETYINKPRMMIPFSPSMDILTSGGILEGSWVGITGNEKTGKTMSALSFAANCQLPEYGSRRIFYIKAEGRLSTKHMKEIKGLRFDNEMFNIIASRKGKILSSQENCKIMEEIMKTVPGCVVILDSISSLCDGREQEEGVGTETRGGGAKIFSQFLNITSNYVPVNDIIFIGITHLMCNTGAIMNQPKIIEKATRRWAYQCDYRLKTKFIEQWSGSKNRQLGIKINWHCSCSPTGKKCDATSYFRFGTGIDRLYELLAMGISLGMIKAKGAWYTMPYLVDIDQDASQKNYSGSEGVYKALLDNEEWSDVLQQKVMDIMIDNEYIPDANDKDDENDEVIAE